MNEQLRLLIELQKLDSIILSTRLKMDAIPATISSHEGPLKSAEAAYENVKQQHASLEKKKKDKERDIEDIKEKIKKLKQRTSEIKTNKEYQAQTKEIEKAEKELKSSEDEMLSIMDSIEGSSKVLEIEKGRITEEKAKIEVMKKELEKEVLEWDEEFKKLKKNRKGLTDKIDSGIYNEYMTIMKASRGIAVVEAKDEACQGCNMHIPPQLFVEIKTGDEIINCPQCRRILYYVKPEAME
ncbi:MAG: C4-type zinc ribbon domain-containing protein [Nitrospirae bacterium]|nr:C4-type zinc ribbon domain-containing protein [Nitrospirota bacterium]MCL5062794.1 C4-type zinc ribbon domain-containing protein [Nitrospirota bacterium]MDA8338700.1 C4-type zinc ribbon domain-containing protein [Nitrospiraceae bacterium]